MTTQQPWPWPERMDARHAAPASHRVLLDNDRVRVLEVVIEPGAREPEHTHRAVGVMIVDEPARIRYYQGAALRFESPASSGSPPGIRVRWMEPEGPHSVENIDARATMRSASNSSSTVAMLSPNSRSRYAGQGCLDPGSVAGLGAEEAIR